jgi:UPF0042 nucleotide-binding protein
MFKSKTSYINTNIIDTTELKPKELKERIKRRFANEKMNSFSINVTSFGFKHGIQKEAKSVHRILNQHLSEYHV